MESSVAVPVDCAAPTLICAHAIRETAVTSKPGPTRHAVLTRASGNLCLTDYRISRLNLDLGFLRMLVQKSEPDERLIPADRLHDRQQITLSVGFHHKSSPELQGLAHHLDTLRRA